MKNIFRYLIIAAACSGLSKSYLKAVEPVLDSIQPNSVWRKENLVLIILDRNGETFRGRFEVGTNIVREISGTVKGDKISWLAKNVHAIKGKPGHDNFGTIKGDKIDFTYSLNGVPGGPPFTLTRDRSNEKPAAQPLLGPTGSQSPALQVTTHKADETKISILSEESVNVTGWITAPLDVAVPEQIWENLNFMKEALKDEAVQKPVASIAAYQLGVRLCLKMLEDLEERNQISARAGGNAVLHQKSNLTQQNRDHLTWPQFFLERDERAERHLNARNADKFMNGHIMIEWTGKAGNMRKEIQLLYSQFREALRQTASGPGSKSPAETSSAVIMPGASRMDGIVLPLATFSNASLADALEYFSIRSRELGPGKTGLSFIAREETRTLPVKITFDLHQVKLVDAVRYTAMIARLKVKPDGDAVLLQRSEDVHPPFAALEPSPRSLRHAGIVFPNIPFAGASLREAATFFSIKTRDLDSQHEVAHIIIDPDLIAANPKITMGLKNATLSDAMHHVCQLAGAEVVCVGDAFYWQPTGK